MFDYRLEYLLSLTAALGEHEEIGPVPEGFRRNVHVIGGDVTGPRVSGKLRPLSGDWLTLRRDGIAILDVRITIETTDGALIYLTYSGTADWGEDAYERALQGRPPSGPIAIRISPRFCTAHPAYLWLNRLHCLGIGERTPGQPQVAYDIYAVR